MTRVGGDLWLSDSDKFIASNGFKIKTLTPLEKVNGAVSVRGNSLTSLETLKYVVKNLSLRFSNVTDLGDLEYVDGNLLISKYNLEYYSLSKIMIYWKITKYND